VTDHKIEEITKSLSPLGYESHSYRCSCGYVSRVMQPQHVVRSHSLHRGWRENTRARRVR